MNDIVYFLKDGENPELTYSLRSVVKNFPYRKIWFYGGKPSNIEPDEYVPFNQWKNKWGNVQMMLKEACQNEKITPNFFIFNDDFYVTQKIEHFENMYDGDLLRRIFRLEMKHGYNGSEYIQRLRIMATELLKFNPYIELKNYAVHVPMLVNKKQMLDTLEKFPNIIMYRCLYGNFKDIGGVEYHDRKYHKTDCNELAYPYISTSDYSFKHLNIGKIIRDSFNEASKYER